MRRKGGNMRKVSLILGGVLLVSTLHAGFKIKYAGFYPAIGFGKGLQSFYSPTSYYFIGLRFTIGPIGIGTRIFEGDFNYNKDKDVNELQALFPIEFWVKGLFYVRKSLICLKSGGIPGLATSGKTVTRPNSLLDIGIYYKLGKGLARLFLPTIMLGWRKYGSPNGSFNVWYMSLGFTIG